jgi:hypothetical protein
MSDSLQIGAQRRRARRTALLLGVLALCVYFGFILSTVLRN